MAYMCRGILWACVSEDVNCVDRECAEPGMILHAGGLRHDRCFPLLLEPFLEVEFMIYVLSWTMAI